MKIIILVSASIVALSSCNDSKNEKNNPVATVSVSFDSAYRPAVFTDPSRMEKITQALPVVDKIFKDYADSSHLPGVAYGLVVDGKLIYKEQYWLHRSRQEDFRQFFLFVSNSVYEQELRCNGDLKLRDEGKLNLDDPAYLYIPELRNLKYPYSRCTTHNYPPLIVA